MLTRIQNLLIILLLSGAVSGWSHPMPHSVLLLDVKHNSVEVELSWPLKELQVIFPGQQIDTAVQTLIARKGPGLDAYLMQHMHLSTTDGQPWTVQILDRRVSDTAQEMTGRYHELTYRLLLQPPAGISPRHFTMQYDAIVHQLVTHKTFVAIRQDWEGGLSTRDSADADLGVLMMDLSQNAVPPLVVNLDEGSRWKGFKSMVSLGIDHIKEGTDHLLFLLVLLLPAPLLVSGSRWGASGGMRYSIIRLLKIVTAFTIGHSITLILGAVGWVHLPSKPVEMLIAVSILVGAIHSLRPLFPGRESFVAAGFGLVHGLAFAATLSSLHLDAGGTALSILGFNIGIELMQLFVILLTVPWLIILSDYKAYKWVRLAGGVLTAIAAIAWLIERATQKPNAISKRLDVLTVHGNYMVLVLAIIAILCTFISKKSPSQFLVEAPEKAK